LAEACGMFSAGLEFAGLEPRRSSEMPGLVVDLAFVAKNVVRSLGIVVVHDDDSAVSEK